MASRCRDKRARHGLPVISASGHIVPPFAVVVPLAVRVAPPRVASPPLVPCRCLFLCPAGILLLPPSRLFSSPSRVVLPPPRVLLLSAPVLLWVLLLSPPFPLALLVLLGRMDRILGGAPARALLKLFRPTASGT